MKRAASERRDREAAFRVDLLLDAAEKVFLEKGFAAAPVEEIAKRAGVALATLYKSIPSKEDAFLGVLHRHIDQFHSWIRDRSSTGTPEQRLESVVHGTLEYFEDHEAAFRLYFVPHGVPWNLRAGLGETTLAKYLEFVSYMEELCGAASRNGRKPSPRLRALAVSGLLNNVIVDGFVQGSGPPSLREHAPAVWALLRPVALGR